MSSMQELIGYRCSAPVSHEKYSPRQMYSDIKLAHEGLSPTPHPRNMRGVLPREFYFPVKDAGQFSLTGYKTRVVPARWLHTATSGFGHEKDVLTSPEKQDQRGGVW